MPKFKDLVTKVIVDLKINSSLVKDILDWSKESQPEVIVKQNSSIVSKKKHRVRP